MRELLLSISFIILGLFSFIGSIALFGDKGVGVLVTCVVLLIFTGSIISLITEDKE